MNPKTNHLDRLPAKIEPNTSYLQVKKNTIRPRGPVHLTPAWRPTLGTPSRCFELRLRRGRWLDDATFEDEAADPELPVEDELVLEAVEDDDIKSGDAAEGQGVGPEAAGLELASPGADVN
ncbi:hypothetical protein ACFX2H_045596 [Malus domestica]